MAAKKYKWGIIGAGKLSSALLSSWLKNKSVNKNEVWAATQKPASAKIIRDKFKIKTVNGYQDLIKNTESLILGVKPYQIDDVCTFLKNSELKPTTLIVSLAAGVGTGRIESAFDHKVPVVLAMTNTPSQVGEGMTAIIKGRYAESKHLKKVEKLFQSSGKCIQMIENNFHEYTALAASSPAFVFYLMKTFVESGVKFGLKEKELNLMISQVFLGAAKLLQSSNKPIDELISQVTTPGGCTAEGVKVLQESELLNIIYKSLEKTREKSKVLAKS